MAVTGGLGNQSRADIVLSLAREQPNNVELVSNVEHACRAFNILRENRNILIHSHSIFPTNDGTVHWRRATGKGPTGHLTTAASFADLEQMIESIVNLGLFTIELVGMIKASKEGVHFKQMSERPLMPTRLRMVSDSLNTE